MNTNNMIIKRGNVELNVEPLFDFMDLYGPQQDVSENIEGFVDSVLPHAKDTLINGADNFLNCLDTVNQLKLVFRKM